jgi:hypothetical protein
MNQTIREKSFFVKPIIDINKWVDESQAISLLCDLAEILVLAIAEAKGDRAAILGHILQYRKLKNLHSPIIKIFCRIDSVPEYPDRSRKDQLLENEQHLVARVMKTGGSMEAKQAVSLLIVLTELLALAFSEIPSEKGARVIGQLVEKHALINLSVTIEKIVIEAENELLPINTIRYDRTVEFSDYTIDGIFDPEYLDRRLSEGGIIPKETSKVVALCNLKSGRRIMRAGQLGMIASTNRPGCIKVLFSANGKNRTFVVPLECIRFLKEI